MNPCLHTHDLWFTPLSPVHMGSGEDYEPTNYVIESRMLYEFDPGSLADVFSSADREALLDIVSSQPTGILQAIQAFFFNRRERLIPHNRRRVYVSEGVAELYASRIGRTAQVATKEINRLEIQRTYNNPHTGALVLPGSGIKGALRTALLDKVNQGKPLRVAQDADRENKKLQKELFAYEAFERDPLRLLKVGDALAAHALRSEIMFAVNRKKHPITKQGKPIAFQAEQGGLYQLLESVPALSFRAFRAEATRTDVSWIPGHHDKLPQASLRFALTDPSSGVGTSVVAACNRYYRPALEKELELLDTLGYLDKKWTTAVRRLLNGSLGNRLDRNQVMLLRLGRHCGAECVTLEGVRSIRIKRSKKQGSDRCESSARTVWLAASHSSARDGMLPFGWAVVEAAPRGESLGEWPELEELCQSFASRQAGLEVQEQAVLDRFISPSQG